MKHGKCSWLLAVLLATALVLAGCGNKAHIGGSVTPIESTTGTEATETKAPGTDPTETTATEPDPTETEATEPEAAARWTPPGHSIPRRSKKKSPVLSRTQSAARSWETVGVTMMCDRK